MKSIRWTPVTDVCDESTALTKHFVNDATNPAFMLSMKTRKSYFFESVEIHSKFKGLHNDLHGCCDISACGTVDIIRTNFNLIVIIIPSIYTCINMKTYPTCT